MAKLSSGILGGISGKVGNVVGGRWRGIDYIRSKPASVKNPNTEAQQKQRTRFRLIGRFLSKAGPVIRLGFLKRRQNRTAFNEAMAVNLREAVSGTFPDLSIDPEKLTLCRGDLAGSSSYSLDLSTPEQAVINWSNDGTSANGSSDDAVLTLLYNIEKEDVIYRLNSAVRDDESAQMQIPASWSGDTVAGYIAFHKAEPRQVSDSLYLGSETAS